MWHVTSCLCDALWRFSNCCLAESKGTTWWGCLLLKTRTWWERGPWRAADHQQIVACCFVSVAVKIAPYPSWKNFDKNYMSFHLHDSHDDWGIRTIWCKCGAKKAPLKLELGRKKNDPRDKLGMCLGHLWNGHSIGTDISSLCWDWLWFWLIVFSETLARTNPSIVLRGDIPLAWEVPLDDAATCRSGLKNWNHVLLKFCVSRASINTRTRRWALVSHLVIRGLCEFLNPLSCFLCTTRAQMYTWGCRFLIGFCEPLFGNQGTYIILVGHTPIWIASVQWTCPACPADMSATFSLAEILSHSCAY